MKKRLSIYLLIACACWLLRPVSTEFLDLPYSAVVNDMDGDLLSARIADDHQWRFPISDEVSDRFEKSIITFEDKRFYNHPGLDPLALGRAIKQNINAGKVVSGASTLTMQLARLVGGHADRSIWNKLKEVNFALRLELWYSKNEILNWYASLAPYGGNVVGLEAACWRYFRKKSNQLSWAEAATLAVLPNAPSLIHVNKNRNLLKSKRDRLLNQLYLGEHLSDIDLEAAKSESLPMKTYDLPNDAPHYLEFYKKRDDRYLENQATIDGRLQRAIADILDQLYLEWSENEIYNAAALILDAKTGEVLSYHGNIPATTQEDAVDLVQAPRSSGSILKPFLYAHMINEGLISPTALTWDIPTYIAGFNPSNYNKTYNGAVHADEALQRSLNVPAVRMLQSYGIDKLLHHLKSHGLTTLDKDASHYGLSLILGGGEVTLWELAHAYRDLGVALLDNASDDHPPLDDGAVYQTLEALKGLNRPDEEGSWELMDSRSPIAWKTGTSYGHRDAWAIGVSPEVTIATWVGNADGEGRDEIIGTSTAGRLLFAIEGIVDTHGDWFEPPYEEMAFMRSCTESGHLAGPNCPNVTEVYWPMITERSRPCSYHKTVFCTEDNMYRIEDGCLHNADYHLQHFLDLPATVARYYRKTHPEYQPIPPLHPACSSTRSADVMEFTYPLHNDEIYLPRDLNAVAQSLVAKISHRHQETQIFWYLDDRYLGSTDQFHTMALGASAGAHMITAIDAHGNKLTRSFTFVKDDRP